MLHLAFGVLTLLLPAAGIDETRDILSFHAVVYDEYISFVCSTNGVFALCSVEFLVNQVTADNFRFHNKTCFHHRNNCEPNECQCDQNCSLFQWNYTSIHSTTTEYSCSGVIEKTGKCYRFNAFNTLRFDPEENTIKDHGESIECAVVFEP